MKKHRLLPLAPFAAGLTLALTAAAQHQPPAERPNILLILADDLGYGELGCYGQKLVPTPNLDRLAAEGMRFTQFYAGSTVCAPSRSVLMTGRHMGHTRVRGNSGANNYAGQTLQAGDVTVASLLQRTGYATGLTGKWGLGEADTAGAPWRQGFDYFYGFLNQTHAHNHFPDFLWRNQERVTLPNDLVKVGPVPGVGYATKRGRYADDAFFDEAEAFVERNRDRPFFLEVSLTVPHANGERARALGDGMEVPDYGSYADRDWPDHQKGHAAMNERMDRRVGKLLELLARLGLDRRTLVLFTSDNGPHREGGKDYDPEFIDSNGPLGGIKRDLTDGGIRVPLLARWPGRIKAGGVSDHVGYFGDFMATFVELAGGTMLPEHDSLSLVPTLLGHGKQAEHEYLYWEFYERKVTQAVLIGSRWKAIRQPALTGPVRLHDLNNDLGETTDVAAQHPEIVARAVEIMRTAHVPNEHWKLSAPTTAESANAPAKP